jgi:hypothetical protein
VAVQVEVFRPEILEDPIIVFVIDENRAEDGLFGVDIMRKCSF